MSLFHRDEFVALNGLQDELLVDGDARLLLGPARGTYGGFAGCERLEQMEALLAYAPQACTVKLAPVSHDPVNFSRSLYALERAGFRIGCVDLNYDCRPLELDFTAQLADGNRKKLAKAKRAGITATQIDLDEWLPAYNLLLANRQRAGHKLSVPLADIVKLEEALPGTHEFYAARAEDGAMLAAAICLWVDAGILYIYAWGDTGKSTLAPTVVLADCIYESSCIAGARLLDCGIATERGVLNDGLARFKESLGFTPSAKLTMVRA